MRSDSATRTRSFGDNVRVILGPRSHGNRLIQQTLKHNYAARRSNEPERKIKLLHGKYKARSATRNCFCEFSQSVSTVESTTDSPACSPPFTSRSRGN